MQVHEKYNFTRFVTDFGFCLDKDGMEYVVAVLKATFHFSDTGEISVPPRKQMLPVFKQDQYRDKPDNSSLQYPSDIVHTKNGTDIILNGHAYGRGLKSVKAGFQLGSVEKMIVANGTRYWDKVVGKKCLMGPLPFNQLALIYENAYGGSYEDSVQGCVRYRLNPVGAGFTEKGVWNQALPGLEYPDQEINTASQKRLPAAFNAVPAWWEQRTQYCGTFDDAWNRTRRPLLPLDFNDHFYNTVPSDQILEPKLQGNERLWLFNLHPRQESLELYLPMQSFIATFRIKDRTEPVPMVADTLVIEPDDFRFTLSYTSAVPIGNDIKFLKSVHFEEA